MTVTRDIQRDIRRDSRVTGTVTFAVSHGTPTLPFPIPARPGPAQPLSSFRVTSKSNVQSVPRELRRIGLGGDAR